MQRTNFGEWRSGQDRHGGAVWPDIWVSGDKDRAVYGAVRTESHLQTLEEATLTSLHSHLIPSP